MKNKILKQLAAMLMCAVILLALPLSAYARRPLVDFTQKGSVTFTLTHDGKPVSGGTWTIYRAADISYEDGNLIWVTTPEFTPYGYDFNTIDLTGPCDGLRSLIELYNIQGETKYVGNDGKITFDNLTPGLYYISQWQNAPGFYRAEAFFANVPFFNGEEYIYDVVATPKTRMYSEGIVTPPPTPPTPPKIPNTGIMQWHIPVLAFCGIAMFIFGWYQFRKGEQ